jgi:hypothetical protein
LLITDFSEICNRNDENTWKTDTDALSPPTTFPEATKKIGFLITFSRTPFPIFGLLPDLLSLKPKKIENIRQKLNLDARYKREVKSQGTNLESQGTRPRNTFVFIRIYLYIYSI